MSNIKYKKTPPPDLVKNLLSRTEAVASPEPQANAALFTSPASTSPDQGLPVAAPATSAADTVKPSGLKAGIDLACKISDVLIFFGWVQDDEQPLKSVRLGGLPNDLSSSLYRFARPDLNIKLEIDSDHALGFLLLIDAPKAAPGGTLTLDAGSGLKVITYQLARELKDNPIFNDHFGELIHAAEVQGFNALHTMLSKFAVPAKKVESSIRAAIDYCYMLPGGALFTSGWAFCTDGGDVTSMQARIGSEKVELYASSARIPREDLKHGFTDIGIKAKTAGFIGCVQTSALECPKKLTIKVTASNKETLSLEVVPKLLEDRNEVSRIVLSYLDISKDGFSEKLDQSLGETLQIALQHQDKSKFELKQQQFGQPPAAPQISIIVPIYGRIDFVKYQLSQFADDSDFKSKVELIYVLDDPNLESIFFRYCADQAPLFQVPFKAVTYGVNLGYAGANNVAAGLASTKLLLLLNSDVLPQSPGWVSTLIKEYTALKDVGAMTPKLLFEDGSVQHAGISFQRFAALDGMWANEHPGKGMPDTESPSPKPVEMPAVTAACMMIAKALYDKVGGLDERYFLGDFEDTDLCLKLIELGKKNYYLPSLTLYHLERQSQSMFENTNDWKTKVTIYNCWQHTRRWDSLIAKLTGEAA